MRKDYIAIKLRLELNRLRSVLGNIEEEKIDCGYAHDSLKAIELNLRQIRKLCSNNN
jgi:hypothetical protein